MQHHVSDLTFNNYPSSNLRRRKSKVKGLNIGLQKFQSFSLKDLEFLKDDHQWLTDSHVTLGLLSVGRILWPESE